MDISHCEHQVMLVLRLDVGDTIIIPINIDSRMKTRGYDYPLSLGEGFGDEVTEEEETGGQRDKNDQSRAEGNLRELAHALLFRNFFGIRILIAIIPPILDGAYYPPIEIDVYVHDILAPEQHL